MTLSGIRRIGGWLLVIFGIAIAAFGFVGMGYYSPSFTEEDYLRIGILGVTIMAVGVLMIIVGWFVLRKKKGV